MINQKIKTITLPLPHKLGSVNCYLIKTDKGFILVDTGGSNARLELEKEIQMAGCVPGNLHLIVLTHGDFDHIGNANYLREKYGARIIMHKDDVGMAERGNMFCNRKRVNILFKVIAPVVFGFKKSNRFLPDQIIVEGFELSEYGIQAKVLSIPGHSKGSIGILTTEGDLFCGDLLDNTETPTLNIIMDDPVFANTSLEKLENLGIKKVYPGHGKPFSMENLR